MKYILLLLILVSRSPLLGNDTVLVALERYVADSALGLVLVGGGVDDLNMVHQGAKGTILLDQYYTFDEPVQQLFPGVAHVVQDESGAPHTLFFTELPLIWLDTDQQIVDEPKVPGHFRMVAPGELLAPSPIGIELRGAYAQSLPKKSYRIAFRSDTTGTTNIDVSLLGMRSDDDWNLLALYDQPLRLRSKLGQELWMEMHAPHYAAQEPEARSGSRMAHVEVVLNGRYQGVYALCEPIDRKQLQLRHFNGTQRGRLYKSANWGPAVDMTSQPPFDNDSLTWGGFEYEYPEEAVDWAQLHQFVGEVVYAEQEFFQTIFPMRFHMGNAVDYFLFLNMLRAVDNRSKNTYIAKHHAMAPCFYVPWDLDGTFGRSWDGTVDSATTSVLFNAMYQRIRWDCSSDGFMRQAKLRWNELREDVFTTEAVMDRFHEAHDALASQGVYQREQMAWTSFTYDTGELARTARWLDQRLAYLDTWFAANCTTTDVGENQATDVLRVYPNPASDRVVVEGAALRHGAVVEVVDGLGRIVMTTTAGDGRATISIPSISSGYYLVRIGGHVQITRKLMIK
ncbi:MAG: CotH kinase family protein [Flavobacteriales bacterium]|nr:CotH kinase family protein [Flavobacteriales bacterium]